MAIKSYLQYLGIPGDKIETEDASTSTRENAIYARRFLQNPAESAVVLTSDYHAYRAGRAFQKAGLKVKMWPIADVCKRGATPALRWGAFLDLAKEMGKIAYYRARGWI
jgi:uncharacterized SAM-binding protein YcdF (DUF218 family)